jgi:zinc protease
VDAMNAGPPNNIDPELFGVLARVKNAADLPSIQEQIIATAEGFASKPVDSGKLDALKEHLRYEFALRLDNSESVAASVAQYVALRRTPETINRYYDAYARLTPADIGKTARKYLIDKNRTVVTLTSKAVSK